MKTYLPAVLVAFVVPLIAVADTIELKSGEVVHGVIQKIEAGRVFYEDGGQVKNLPIVSTVSIVFDTAHADATTPGAEHFTQDRDAQHLTKLTQELKQTRAELNAQLAQIKKTWLVQQPVDKNQSKRWDASKETFQAPMKQYQAILQDMYQHVAAQVDAYNKLAADADKVYVGVKGIFNVGSPLITQDLANLQPKKFVSRTWYDSIFYEGYRKGFVEGGDQERLMRIPPSTAETGR